MVEDDKEHGKGAEENGECVEIIIGYHVGGQAFEWIETKRMLADGSLRALVDVSTYYYRVSVSLTVVSLI